VAVLAFIQHRLGRTDGVSLEVDKWRSVLERHGHTVHYIAGNEDVPGGCSVPELYPFHPVTERIIRNATRRLEDYDTPADLIAEVEQHAWLIKPQLERFFDELGVDLILPNNLLSVGYNLPGMVALARIVEERKLPTICHNHDFWWEDSGEVYPTCEEVINLYRRYAPPDFPWVQHVTINRIGQDALRGHRGIESTVVPNVFDFSVPVWNEDEYNRDFRESLGLDSKDLMFLQATRILDRKAIELAIDVVGRIAEPRWRRRLEGTLYDGRQFGSENRIALVCSGYVEGIGLTDTYPQALEQRARQQGVELIWAGEHVKHSRGRSEDGKKIYSLWDSYVQADMVTYPSIWEGWGNQFIEAVFARLPVVLFEYPVWRSDLAQVGFDVASLGDRIAGHDEYGLVQVTEEQLERAVEKTVSFLKDGERRRQATEHNYALAERFFSYDALESYIMPLVDRALGSQGV
jgi:hypothetical protein